MNASIDATLPEKQARLERLQDYLQQDPDNLSLLSDVALAAFEAAQPSLAKELFIRYKTLAEPSDSLLNMAGLLALRENNVAGAIGYFTELASVHPKSAEVIYNLAYAEGLSGEFDRALERLSDDISIAYPPAALLRMRLLHHAGRIDEAIAEGESTLIRGPGASDVEGLLAVLYLDKGDLKSAATHAAAAGDESDALTTLGMLELESGSTDDARMRFEHLVEAQPKSGRAWLGLGLASLANQSIADARVSLDRAARLLVRHPGSWLASGWAHLLDGSLDDAQVAFEEATRIDRNFAEAHGSLAVLAVRRGESESAARFIAVAMRLDSQCLSAALARSELLRAEGNAAAADSIREAAIHTPGQADGASIYELLVRRGIVSSDAS